MKNPLPLIKTFTCSQSAVQDCQGITETGIKMSFNLGSKGNFRHQNQNGFSQIKTPFRCPKIHLGFTASGYAKEQIGLKFFPVDSCMQFMDNICLLLG